MRLPSVSGIRGPKSRGCLFALLVLALFGANTAFAQAFLNTPTIRQTGNINFTTTGGSLRAAPNVTNACTINTTSTQSLTGIPAGRTVDKAYLYWGASGNTADTSVTLNGTAVTASRTFAKTFNNGTAFNFFGGFAEVTSLVTANGSFTFGGLTVSNGTPWCGSQAVVGGWALVVIYKGATERLRAINIFDGLDYFYGSSVTLNPGGFRIPAANIDGRVAVFTLEGDPQNSGTNGVFSEALRFNGALLDDGLVPANSDPTVQQFDGTVSTVSSVTSYGIDVDQYDVSATLLPGQTSATTVYSAGDDLVLLMAQIVSATSDPAVDLSVTSSHTGTFVAGATGQYTLTVSNAAGFEREDNTVTVTDTLPAGLTFNSATGTGWTCAAVAQIVTCTHAPILNAGASFPPITLTVNVTEAAAPTVTNKAVVSTPSFDSETPNNTDNDDTATIDPTVSTSTKTVVDLNGGEVSPGDTLRYTITLNETAGGQAINVSVVDAIPDNTTFANFFSVPAGATTSYLPPPAGTGNNGQITVSGITVPANASATVVFNVTVVAGTAPGETIDNTAVINNPNGPENSPSAPQLIVNPSLIPAAGVKFLYLRRDAANARSLSRIRPSAADTNEAMASGGSNTWVIAPALQKALVVPAGSIPVRLWLSRNGGTGARNITVTLASSAGGLSITNTVSINPNNNATTPALASITLTNGTARTVPAGATLTLTVSQVGAVNTVTIWPNGNGASTLGVPNNSRVELNTTTVINVDSVLTWSAAFNGGALQTTFYPGATVFVRGTISDPFGSFDISSARITVTDAANAVQVNDQVMTSQGAAGGCGLTTSATCVFQYQFTVPASPSLGNWSIRVTGNEGVEGTVSDFNLGTFTVAIPQPSITMLKTSAVISDPTSSPNPKRIPLAIVRYDITVTNSGPGTVDSNSLVITDPIPTNTTMYVLTSGSPVVFVNGTTASGLTFNYATNVSYSMVGDTGPWTYTPVPDANGFDAVVKAVRVSPSGIMSAAGTGNPSFTVSFRVRIN